MNKKTSNQIDCGTALEWIHLLLDQELPLLDHQKLQSHLQSCKNCSAAQSELSLLENAHTELDKPIAAVPAGYFEELPGRVLARVAKAEARRARAFSLPKPQLPKWQMPSWLHHVLVGRGKYAIAFAAMALLAFIITRQLRQDFSSETVRFEKSTQSPPLAVPEQPPATPVPSEEQTRRDSDQAETATVTDQAESPAAMRLHLSKRAAAGDEVRSKMGAPTNEAANLQQQSSEQKDAAATPMASQPKTDFEHLAFEDSGSRVVYSLDETQKAGGASSHNAFGAGARPAAEAYVPARHEPLRMSKSALSPTSASTSAALFEWTAEQAGHAASEPRRRRIWQDFLKSNPDSIRYYFAVAEIGRSFAAEIDSATLRAGMEEAWEFYNKMQEALISQMGQEAFAREQVRLEGLLQWKKSEEKH